MRGSWCNIDRGKRHVGPEDQGYAGYGRLRILLDALHRQYYRRYPCYDWATSRLPALSNAQEYEQAAMYPSFDAPISKTRHNEETP